MATKLSSKTAQPITPMAPVVIDGRMHIEGLAADLIARGLVVKCNLPGLRGPQAVRSTVGEHSIYALRLRRDFVCVIMPPQMAMQRDRGFMKLMAGLTMFVD